MYGNFWKKKSQTKFIFICVGALETRWQRVLLHNFCVTAAAVDILNVLQLTQEMTVSKTTETVRVKSHFRHTVNYLKKLGVPANNSIQVRTSNIFNQSRTDFKQLSLMKVYNLSEDQHHIDFVCR